MYHHMSNNLLLHGFNAPTEQKIAMSSEKNRRSGPNSVKNLLSVR